MEISHRPRPAPQAWPLPQQLPHSCVLQLLSPRRLVIVPHSPRSRHVHAGCGPLGGTGRRTVARIPHDRVTRSSFTALRAPCARLVIRPPYPWSPRALRRLHRVTVPRTSLSGTHAVAAFRPAPVTQLRALKSSVSFPDLAPRFSPSLSDTPPPELAAPDSSPPPPAAPGLGDCERSCHHTHVVPVWT